MRYHHQSLLALGENIVPVPVEDLCRMFCNTNHPNNAWSSEIWVVEGLLAAFPSRVGNDPPLSQFEVERTAPTAITQLELLEGQHQIV